MLQGWIPALQATATTLWLQEPKQHSQMSWLSQLQHLGQWL